MPRRCVASTYRRHPDILGGEGGNSLLLPQAAEPGRIERDKLLLTKSVLITAGETGLVVARIVSGGRNSVVHLPDTFLFLLAVVVGILARKLHNFLQVAVGQLASTSVFGFSTN